MIRSPVVEMHVALIGMTGCGKSALAVKYIAHRFIGEYDAERETTFMGRSLGHRSLAIRDYGTLECFIADLHGADQALIEVMNSELQSISRCLYLLIKATGHFLILIRTRLASEKLYFADGVEQIPVPEVHKLQAFDQSIASQPVEVGGQTTEQ